MNITEQGSSIIRPIIMIAGLVIIFAGLKAASSIISLFFLAFFLAVLFTPIFRGLVNRGVKPGWAILIMIVGILGGGVALFALTWMWLGQLSDSLPVYQQNLTSQIAAGETLLANFGINLSDVELPEIFSISTIFNVLTGIILSVSNALFMTTIIILTSIFMVLEAASYPGRLSRGFGENSQFLTQYEHFSRGIVRYMIARVKVNLAMAVPVTILMLILGVDLALLWGLVAFLSGFIPVVGMLIAIGPPASLAWLESGWLVAGIVVVGFVAINAIVENILQPKLVGQDLSISPVVVIVSLFFWSWIFGGLGALLAMPLTVLVVLIFDSFDDTRWLAILMSSEEAPEPVAEVEPQMQETND